LHGRARPGYHAQRPFVFQAGGKDYRVGYEPAESSRGLFGRNSNWHGPIWFPVNAVILRSLTDLYRDYRDSFKVECPTGSGTMANLYQVADEIARRLQCISAR